VEGKGDAARTVQVFLVFCRGKQVGGAAGTGNFPGAAGFFAGKKEA
jgi:hypothetical protein